MSHGEALYDVQQVCLSGHVINDRVKDNPEVNQDFCARCGSATTTACGECGTEIRGRHRSSSGPFRPPPAFCGKCGAAFPWTVAGLRAAKELADQWGHLEPQEREDLKRSLDDLVRATPQAAVAGTRFKRIMARVGKEGVEAMRTVVTDMVSETIRKTMGLP